MLAASATLASAAAPEVAIADAPGVVRRTTLVVHDIEASMRFYRDILGFTVWLDSRSKTTADSLPMGVPIGSPSHLVIMKGRHPWIGMIGLLQYGDAKPLPATPTQLHAGDAITMIETRELATIYARMQRAGTPIHKPPVSSEVTGAGGARWQATFLFAFDPDGRLLEINERGAASAAVAINATNVLRAAPADVTVRRRFADVRTGQLHYREAQPRQSLGLLTPVVLLHQSPLSSRMYSELLPELARDRVVYALDTPGYGESDAPAQPLSVAGYADALHDFIANLKEPVDLVGYHTGALLAADIAARYPASVRRLILISVPLFSAERRAALRSDAPILEDGSALLAEWRSTMAVRPAGQSLAQAARIVAEKQRAGERAGWAMAAIRNYDAAAVLTKLAIPTTVIRPKDGLWEASEAAAKMIPHATLIDAPQWAYGLFDAAPAAVAQQLRDMLEAQPSK